MTDGEISVLFYDDLLARVKLIAAWCMVERYGDGTQTDVPATWLPALANAPEEARRIVAAWIGAEQPRETPKARERAPVAMDDDGEEDYIRRALDAVSADDRGTWLRFGAALHDSGHSWARDAWDDWSRRSYKYDARDQETTWRSFGRDYSGQRVTIGSIIEMARRNGFDERKHRNNPEPEANAGALADPVAAIVAELNERYFVVNENGKALIYQPFFDEILKRQRYIRSSFDDVRRLYMNRQVAVGSNDRRQDITKSAAEVWLKHPDRRQFIGGIIFDPSGKRAGPDTFNLWQGFAVEPRPGSWGLLKSHVRENICSGNEEHFNFLMGWMARMIQCPAEQGEVAVVMRGGEGSGKGTLARALLRLLGQHGLHISNSKHLTGNFNAHLRDTILLFADEAFFAGDRAHTGVLKSIITESTITVEPKRVDAYQAPNFIHLMMASNESWVVPASLDARRFFVLNVSNARAQDSDYFGRIWEEMDAGGYEAMLHELLTYDLSSYNSRAVPVTEGLQDQRQLSLPTAESWWLDVLHRGYVYQSKLGHEDHFAKWHETIATDLLFASYESFVKTAGERHPMDRAAFGKFVTRFGGRSVKPRNIVVGERIANIENGYGGKSREAALVRQDRAYGYNFGSLADVRAAFVRETRLTPEWQTADDPSDEED